MDFESNNYSYSKKISAVGGNNTSIGNRKSNFQKRGSGTGNRNKQIWDSSIYGSECNVTQAAEYLGVSRRTVSRWIADKKIIPLPRGTGEGNLVQLDLRERRLRVSDVINLRGKMEVSPHW